MTAAQPMPLISILVPGYNVERYIGDSLAHIVGQMHEGHELIVVDDGSTDGTVACVEAVQAAHAGLRIRLVRQANQGIADARNRALREACGEYILFVDSDDRLLPGSLQALERVIEAQRPDVVATGFRMWHPDAPDKDRDVQMHYPAGRLITAQDEILAPFFDDRHMYVWCKVMRRAIYEQEAMPLFPSKRLFEDVAVVPRLLQHCRSLVYIPHVLLAYRQHPVSITRVISAQWCEDFVTALASVRPHLERGGASGVVRERFDIACCHFYIGVVKNSYQLPPAQGDRVREQVRGIFLGGLFGQPQQVLAAMAGSGDGRDVRGAQQVRQALEGDRWFHFQQSALRKIKLWQRLARTRAQR